MCYWFQVKWINAMRCAARMIENQSFWDRTHKKRVSEPMRKDCRSFPFKPFSNSSVPGFVRAVCPFPTTCVPIDGYLGDESVEKGTLPRKKSACLSVSHCGNCTTTYIIISLLFIFLRPSTAQANQSANGWCMAGAQVVVTSGLSSSTQVQGSFPMCLVQVNLHGGGLATIFADNVGTPLANPFQASTIGQWQFYAANAHYDVTLSGFPTGTTPSTVTISDIVLNDPVQLSLQSCTVAFSATPVFTAGSCSFFTMTLTGNVTASSITGGVTGQIISFSLIQGAGGPWTFAWPVSFLNPPLLTPTAAKSAQFTFALLSDNNWHQIATGESQVFDTAVNGNVLRVNGNGITGVTGSGATLVLAAGTPSFSAGITGTGTIGTLGAGTTLLGTNNSWTGNETHSGTEGFSGGGSLSGTFSGSPTLSGSPVFSGNPSFTGTLGLTNAGVFTDTQMNQYATSNINSINFTTEFQDAQGSHGQTEGFSGGVVIPGAAAVLQAAGLAGYSNNTSTTTDGLGFWAQSRCLANSTKCWGGYTTVLDAGSLTAGLVLHGHELDVSPHNVSTAYSVADGFNLVLNASPTGNTYNGGFSVKSNNTSQWNQGFITFPATAVTAFQAGAACTSGTCNSQPFTAVGLSAGVNVPVSWKADSAGDFLVTPSGGGVLSAPNIGLSAATNQLIFTTANVTAVSAPNPAATRIDTIPDVGASSFFGLNFNATSGSYQSKRGTAGCTTSGGASAFTGACTTTVTFPASFPDTNFSVVCMGRSTFTGVPLLQGATATAVNQATVQTQQATGVNAAFGTIDCVAVHD